MTRWRWLVGCLCALSCCARAAVAVQLEGVDGSIEKNVLANLSIVTDAKRDDLTQDEVERFHDEAREEIRTAVEPFGYYHPEVTSRLSGQAPDWNASYRIRLGPRTHVSLVELLVEGAGRDDPGVQAALEALDVRPGRALDHADYEQLKTRVQRAAYQRGYLDARLVRHDLIVDVDSNEADIEIALQTGPRYYFGDISIEQDEGLDDKFLRRYLKMQPGDPFDPQKLLDTQFALGDLNYFRSVLVDARKDQADPRHRVPIVIRTDPKAPRQYKYGLGYGTDTRARASSGVEFRRLNREGHRLRADVSASQLGESAAVEYIIPTGPLPSDSYSFMVSGFNFKLPSTTEREYAFGPSINHSGHGWQRHYYLKYLRDQFRFNDQTGIVTHLLTPGVSLNRTALDNAISPSLGYTLFLDVHAGAENLLSDSTFVQIHEIFRAIAPLYDRVHLLTRIEYGASLVRNFAFFPVSQRFFAGGQESVRGYSYQSLAPLDPAGNIVGGKYIGTGTLELQFDVYKEYGLTVFTDAGGASNGPGVRLHRSAGSGVVYKAPFGSIEADLSHPFDSGLEPVRLDLDVRVGL